VYTSIDTLPKSGRRHIGQRCGTLGQTTTHSCVPSVFPPFRVSMITPSVSHNVAGRSGRFQVVCSLSPPTSRAVDTGHIDSEFKHVTLFPKLHKFFDSFCTQVSGNWQCTIYSLNKRQTILLDYEKVLVEPTKWLKTLATTLNIQSAACHPASGRSTPWWAVQPRVGRFKPTLGITNLSSAFPTHVGSSCLT
jgi:hypothetical protein